MGKIGISAASNLGHLVIALTACVSYGLVTPPISSVRLRNDGMKRRLSTRVMDELPLIVTDVNTSDTHEVPRTVHLPLNEHDHDRSLIESSLEEIDPIEQFTPFQTFSRLATLSGIVGYAVNPQLFDEATASAWSAIYNWAPAQQPLFEAEVASAGFFMSIAFFSSLHILLGEEKTKASRIDGHLPVDPLSWARPENFHLWFNPLASYLGSIWVYHQFHEKAAMPEIAPTFGIFAFELFFGVVLYDLCFFPIHYLMHKAPSREMRKVHGYHHRWSANTLNSLETVQHSYIDGFLQVAVNILVQQISPFGPHKHAMSRMAHNIVVTYLLSEAHSGYNLPWMSHNIFPEFLGGAPRHEKHHHDGRVYYQQYFKYLDNMIGSTEEGIKRNKQKVPKEKPSPPEEIPSS